MLERIGCLLEEGKTFGLRIPGYRAVEIQADFTEEQKIFRIRSHRSILKLHHVKNREVKGPCKEVFRIVNLKSALCSENRGSNTRRNLATRQGSMAVGENVHKLNNKDKATFFSPSEVRSLPSPSSKKPEEREFVVDSGA